MKKKIQKKRSKPSTDIEVLNTTKDLKTLYQSNGGQILVSGLIDDVVGTMNILASQYKSLSHIEMIGYCAALNEKLLLIHSLSRAEDVYNDLHAELSEEMGDLLDEALRE